MHKLTPAIDVFAACGYTLIVFKWLIGLNDLIVIIYDSDIICKQG